MSKTSIITRFAPSPTGLLHVGNIRTALINWLFTRKAGGTFILRIDDTDLERSRPEFERAILEDLSWLGLEWDKLEHQRSRLDRYEEIKKLLIDQSKLYPCYETAEELEVKRKILLSQGKPPIYDRAALKLTKEQVEEFTSQGLKPHFRFKLESKIVEWEDMVRERVQIDASSISDPVVLREDGTWTYMLCSVVDDIDFGITHIIRGEDHITNTAAHIQMFDALGAQLPIFGHLARITSKTEKISKRKGGFDIKTLRTEKGLEPMTINSFLALTGTSKNVAALTKLDDLIKEFDITTFQKSPTSYDEADLIRLNSKVLASYTFEQMQPKLQQLGLDGVAVEFWNIIRSNLATLTEAKQWYEVCYGEIEPVDFNEDDRKFLSDALALLPQGNWNSSTWDEWINAIKPTTARKNAELFGPIRLALTGMKFGPEMKILLPIIGIDRAIKRLKCEKA